LVSHFGSPVVFSFNKEVATRIKCHTTFFSLVASDLLVKQENNISLIKDKMITIILFTGHSLGVAMASIFHLFMQAQIDGNTKGSDWEVLVSTKDGKDLRLNTVTFADVRSMFLEVKETTGLDRAGIDRAGLKEAVEKNKHAAKLMDKVGKNSCNFLFGPDVVPRAYAHVSIFRKY